MNITSAKLSSKSISGWVPRLLLPALFFLGAAISVTSGDAVAAAVEILTPRPSSTILARNPSTHLILRRPAGGPAIRIRVGSKAKPQVGSDKDLLEPLVEMEEGGKGYLHFRLPLVPGVNSFTILPSGDRIEVTFQEIQAKVPKNVKNTHFFHQSDQLPEGCSGCHDLRKTSIIKPLGLEGQESCTVCHQELSGGEWQHSPVANKQCLTCHQKSVNPWRIGLPTDDVDDICVACHNGKSTWRSRKHIHAVLIVGGCTLCHNPHGSENRYYLWAKNSYELCVGCHSDKDHVLDEDARLPFIHGIGVNCAICHDPHATDNIFVLRSPINELCVGCHYQLNGVERGHPIGRHPVSAEKELRRPGRELSCASCHDPHGTPYPYMLIGEPMEGKVCYVCHKK